MKKGNYNLIIAIDGYSSCGKSTFAKEIARILHYTYIDSGAMYRAVTLFCLRNRIIENDVINITKLRKSLKDIKIEFKYNSNSKQFETYLDDENIEEKIRSVKVSEFVSQISKISEIRSKMVKAQRILGNKKRIVMDGRDIGTVVFPNADLKIFMIAKPAIRAERRYKELIQKGMKVSYEEIEKNIIQRDHIDSTRNISPLKKAPDAITLDNSDMTVEEQMSWIMGIIQNLKKNES